MPSYNSIYCLLTLQVITGALARPDHAGRRVPRRQPVRRNETSGTWEEDPPLVNIGADVIGDAVVVGYPTTDPVYSQVEAAVTPIISATSQILASQPGFYAHASSVIAAAASNVTAAADRLGPPTAAATIDRWVKDDNITGSLSGLMDNILHKTYNSVYDVGQPDYGPKTSDRPFTAPGPEITSPAKRSHVRARAKRAAGIDIANSTVDGVAVPPANTGDAAGAVSTSTGGWWDEHTRDIASDFATATSDAAGAWDTATNDAHQEFTKVTSEANGELTTITSNGALDWAAATSDAHSEFTKVTSQADGELTTITSNGALDWAAATSDGYQEFTKVTSEADGELTTLTSAGAGAFSTARSDAASAIAPDPSVAPNPVPANTAPNAISARQNPVSTDSPSVSPQVSQERNAQSGYSSWTTGVTNDWEAADWQTTGVDGTTYCVSDSTSLPYSTSTDMMANRAYGICASTPNGSPVATLTSTSLQTTMQTMQPTKRSPLQMLF